MSNMLGFVHHLFTPHHKNNFRAKILHHSSIALTILFLLLSSLSSIQLKHSYPNVLGISYSITAEEMLVHVNNERVSRGLEPLQMNQALSNAAYQKAQDMLSKNYWAHFAPDGLSPWFFIKNSGYNYSFAGENLAKGFTNSSDVVGAWMNSTSHRDNILSDKYDDMGFAIVEGNLLNEETVLVVQMFGSGVTQVAQVPEPVAEESSDETIIAGTLGDETIVEEQVAEVTVSEVPEVEPEEEKEIALVGQADAENTLTPSVNSAAILQKPLIDMQSVTRVIAVLLISGFVLAFVIDLLVVERKKIPRFVGHNVDHLMLLIAFLIFLISQSGGGIL